MIKVSRNAYASRDSRHGNGRIRRSDQHAPAGRDYVEWMLAQRPRALQIHRELPWIPGTGRGAPLRISRRARGSQPNTRLLDNNLVVTVRRADETNIAVL